MLSYHDLKEAFLDMDGEPDALVARECFYKVEQVVEGMVEDARLVDDTILAPKEAAELLLKLRG